jgi:hypothetical protein
METQNGRNRNNGERKNWARLHYRGPDVLLITKEKFKEKGSGRKKGK